MAERIELSALQRVALTLIGGSYFPQTAFPMAWLVCGANVKAANQLVKKGLATKRTIEVWHLTDAGRTWLKEHGHG